MSETNLGRVSIVPKGDYNELTEYKRLDVVKYNRNSYQAKADVTGVTPGTDATKWMLQVEGAMSVPEAEAIVEDLQDMIAPTEESSTASSAHAIGNYFIYNGTLYRATADIAVGGTITPNTNCVAVTVGQDLEARSFSAVGAANNQVPTAHGNGTWTWENQQGGGNEPHNYALDGKDLKTVFADADALYAAYAAEDYSNIHVGDYWPITLNGDYWDYGDFTCPAGVTYYSDDGLKTEVGTTEASYNANCVTDAQLPYGLKAYCTIKISNVNYYVSRDDCLNHRVRTLSNAQMYFVVGGINQYWRYGDSGADNFQNGKPHLLMEARDGLPHTLKFRKQNEAWEGTHIATFTGDGTTAEFTIDGTVGTIGYVWVAGTRKAYNTDYTFGSNKITFKSGKIPAANAKIEVEWMDGKTPWTGSALYKSFNDPDHGIIKLIQEADAKLYNHMYKGPNNAGMRYYGETRTKTDNQSGTWEDRGILFLPTEDEIWGRLIFGTGANASVNQQQWPIYGNGGRRQYAKGAGNGASRTGEWCASSSTVAIIAIVNNISIHYTNGAYNVNAAAPCFLLS